ncbi:GmrSD restriction endonuclease domain-containing protein [Mycoplasma sp. 128]
MTEKNNIKYWKIGTNVSRYLDTFFESWMKSSEIRKYLLEKPSEFTIVYEEKKKDNNQCELYFKELKDCFVFRDRTIHPKSTITQFLRILLFTELIVIKNQTNDEEYCVEFSLSQDVIDAVNLHDKDSNISKLTEKLKKHVYDKTMNNMQNLINQNQDFLSSESRKWNNNKVDFFYSILFTIVYNKSDNKKKNELARTLDTDIKNINKSLGYYMFIDNYKNEISRKNNKISSSENYLENKFKTWLYKYHGIDGNNDSIKVDINTSFEHLYKNAKYLNFKDSKRESSIEPNFEAERMTIQEYFKMLFLNKYGDFSVLIPLFQRGYAWNNELIQRLVKDVFSLANSENEQETLDLGFISLLKDNESSTYWLIDGQQRTMTLLVICYWAIRMLYSSEAKDLEINGYDNLVELFEPKTINGSKTLYVLNKFVDLQQIKCYKNLNEFFMYPQKYKNKEAIKEFLKTKEFIESELNSYKVNKRAKILAKFIDCLLNNIIIVAKVNKKKEDTFKFFESINTLSKPLQTYDIFFSKLYSLHVSHYKDKGEAERQFRDFKKQMKLNANNKDILENIFQIIMLKNFKKTQSEKISIYNIGKTIEEIIDHEAVNDVENNNKQKIVENLKENLITELWRMSYIKHGDLDNPKIIDKEKRNQLKFIYTLMVSKIKGIFIVKKAENLPDVAINLIYIILDKFGVFDDECLNDYKIHELRLWLKTLEKVIIWWKTKGNFHDRSLRSNFDRIAIKILDWNDKNSKYEIDTQEELKIHLINEISNIKEVTSFDQDFNKLVEDGLNEWNKEENKHNLNEVYTRIWLKLILEYIYPKNDNLSTTPIDEVDTIYNKIIHAINKDKNKDNELSLEHCHPQKPREGSKLFKNEDDKKYLYSIGNTCLIPKNLNSKMSNKDFKEKINTYPQDKALNFLLKEMKFPNATILGIDSLDQKTIKKVVQNIKDRQDNIIKALQEIYKGV